MSAHPPQALRARIALTLVTVVWGSTFPLSKMVLTELPPFLYLAIRYSVAAAMMLLLFRRTALIEWRKTWRFGAPIGAVLCFAYLGQTAGVDLTTANKAGFLTGLSVVLVPLFQALWFKSRPSNVSLLSAAASFIGLALLSGFLGSSSDAIAGTAEAFNLGDIYVLFSAIMFALHILLIDRLPQEYPRETMVTQQFLIVAVLALPLSLMCEPLPTTMPSSFTWSLVLFLSLFATVCAFATQAWAQKHLNATHTALILILEPVFSAAFSWLWLGEQLSWLGLLGATLIVCSMMGSSVEPEHKPGALSEGD